MDEHGRSLVGTLRHSPDVGWGLLDFAPHSNASVAIANDRRALVAWRQGEWILGSRLPLDGEWGPPETIGAGMTRSLSGADLSASKSVGIMDSNGIDLAINASGELMVVWHTVGSPNYNPPHTPWRFSIWANRFEPGVGWGTPTPLSTNETNDAYWPRIDMDELGHEIAVWHEASGYGQDPARVWWSRYEETAVARPPTQRPHPSRHARQRKPAGRSPAQSVAKPAQSARRGREDYGWGWAGGVTKPTSCPGSPQPPERHCRSSRTPRGHRTACTRGRTGLGTYRSGQSAACR